MDTRTRIARDQDRPWLLRDCNEKRMPLCDKRVGFRSNIIRKWTLREQTRVNLQTPPIRFGLRVKHPSAKFAQF